ncbi:OsmC family protein [Acholeplasma equirhinis]|uniref:OsmC family protein n=1 Tax=Acholeplasma equirhinis TaxID=555393 RepID=UPI00197AFE48|nr:OsmC family protein [Acholeplasma equirhinis]MBN3491083.1 OsmC family protein [Acholeplasma equirhinis]
MKHVYETTITNIDGLAGTVKADSGYTFTTDGVKNADSNHTNPEQLIGASWATCLAATLHSVLVAKGIKPVTRIDVKVDLWFDDKTRYQFKLHANVAIQGVSLDDAEKYLEITHRFCPVSKLIADKEAVTWSVAQY